ncbi:MAG: hypothetical protein COV47_00980 [Candidatus Diapherotrites archaeon CG11_big_fil_rev_8_21_14_0_20_37_9]|nr:MAG: hypothetical protein COV47_00980 [Candidatus Diapherotrites archaeon CG11_big_fil_rev_8_21_14_0_20_37_9]
MKLSTLMAGSFLFMGIILLAIGIFGTLSIQEIQNKYTELHNVSEHIEKFNQFTPKMVKLVNTKTIEEFETQKKAFETEENSFMQEHSKISEENYFDIIAHDSQTDKFSIISSELIEAHKQFLNHGEVLVKGQELEETQYEKLVILLSSHGNDGLETDIAKIGLLSKQTLYNYKNKDSFSKWLDKIDSVTTEVKESDITQVEKDSAIEILTEYKEIVSTYGNIVVSQKNIEKIRQDKIDELILLNQQVQQERHKAISAKTAEIEAIVSDKNNIIYNLMIFTLLISIALGILISHSISGGIRHITENVEEISKGNFNVEIDSKTSIEEINMLGRALDRIMKTMKLAVLETEFRYKNTKDSISPENKLNEAFRV